MYVVYSKIVFTELIVTIQAPGPLTAIVFDLNRQISDRLLLAGWCVSCCLIYIPRECCHLQMPRGNGSQTRRLLRNGVSLELLEKERRWKEALHSRKWNPVLYCKRIACGTWTLHYLKVKKMSQTTKGLWLKCPCTARSTSYDLICQCQGSGKQSA